MTTWRVIVTAGYVKVYDGLHDGAIAQAALMDAQPQVAAALAPASGVKVTIEIIPPHLAAYRLEMPAALENRDHA